MMKRPISIVFFAAMSFLWVGCGKEVSFQVSENAVVTGGSGGTLKGSPGACLNVLVTGIYGQSLALDSSHNILVHLEVPKAGAYQLRSDTINGIYFSGSVVATGTGSELVKMTGYGTPVAAGQFTFTLRSGSSFCSVVVEVFPKAMGSGLDYFPMTPLSRWTFKSSDPLATAADTLLQVSTSLQRQLGTPVSMYQVFALDYGSTLKDSAFYKKSGTEYSEYGDIDVSGSGDHSSPADYTFLKETATLGAEWFSPEVNNKVGGNPVKFRLKFKIIEKSGTAFVGSWVFANLIKVRVVQQVQLSSIAPWSDIFSYETWFAQGVGLVNVVAPAPVYGYRLIKFNVL
jgi:hypothetical protein